MRFRPGFPAGDFHFKAMKKALLLSLVGWLLAAAPALAHPPMPANVNFTSERGVPFGLMLDGRPLTRGVARQVHVDRLQPGQHWADFVVPTAYGGAVRFHSRVWLQPGLETTFVLVARPGWPISLQQVNAVALCAPGYGGGNGYYNGGGRRNGPTGYDPAPYGQGGGYGNQGSYGNSDPYDNGNDDDDDDYGNPLAPSTGYGTSPNNPNSGGYGNNPNTPGGGYHNGPSPGDSYPGTATSSYRQLVPPDVDALVKTVRARIAEAGKLSAAKDGLAERSLRADDLSRLLRTIGSEAYRIDLATFAYSHVSDPENFSRVYDAFGTESGARTVEAAVSLAPQR